MKMLNWNRDSGPEVVVCYTHIPRGNQQQYAFESSMQAGGKSTG